MGRPAERNAAKRYVNGDGLDTRVGGGHLTNFRSRSIVDVDDTATEAVHGSLRDLHRPAASGTETDSVLVGHLAVHTIVDGVNSVIEGIEARNTVVGDGH